MGGCKQVPTTLGAASRAILGARLQGLPPVVHTLSSGDGTTKMLVRLADGLEVEAVLIPHAPPKTAAGGVGGGGGGGHVAETAEAAAGWVGGRPAAEGHTTLCVSSQVPPPV